MERAQLYVSAYKQDAGKIVDKVYEIEVMGDVPVLKFT